MVMPCSLPVAVSFALTWHDAVRIDVEGDLDLRDATRRRRDTGQLEHAELLVVGRDLPLTLEHLDLHGRLVVVGRGEDLGALRRDRGVALDQLVIHAALGLDTEGQRGTSSSRTSLTSPLSTPACSAAPTATTFVRVDTLVGLLAAGQLLDQFGHRWHAGGTTDQQTWSMSAILVPPSLITLLNGARQRSSRSDVMRWNSARDSVSSRNSGVLVAVDVM